MPEVSDCPFCQQEIRNSVRWIAFPVHLLCTTAVYLACKWFFGTKGFFETGGGPWLLYCGLGVVLMFLIGAAFTEYRLKSDPFFRSHLIAYCIRSCPLWLLMLNILFIAPLLGLLLVGEAIK